MIKQIQLHGILAEKFGANFEFDIENIKEATLAIACQNKEFKRFMINADIEGLKFAIFTDEVDVTKNVAEKDLENYTDAKTIHIVPIIQGAGGENGIFQLIAGAALVAVGVFTGQPYLVSMGAALAIGGVTSMLMPTPEIEGQDNEGNKPSNGFGGAITTTAQGNIVGVLYGEREIGGAVLSGAIYTEDTA